MTKKADFNAEAWSQVLEGPLMAGVLVIAADRGGTLRESLSMGKAYAEARQQHSSSELLDAIVASNPQLEPDRMGSVEDLQKHGIGRVREAVAVVEANATPEEADEYKRFIRSVAEQVARAHKEGGFLGIGGKEVSDSEQAVLDQIGGALD